MKVNFNAGMCSVEVEGNSQKEVFKQLAEFQEVFDNSRCGACESTNVRFVVRNVDDNEFFEIRCKDCGAKLAFGSHKKGNSLFPKRKNSEGNYIENQGWQKYVPQKNVNA